MIITDIKTEIRMKTYGRIILMAPAGMLAAVTALSASAAPLTAPEVVTKAASAISAGKVMEVSFTISSGGHASKGTLKASGSKFAVSLPEGSSWYNGKHLYSYNPRTKETTVVTPTASELAESNPLLYVNGGVKGYTAVFSKTRIKGKYVVDLTPKSRKSTVRKVTLTINASTFIPEKISVTGTSGQTADVTVGAVRRNVKIAASEFEYPAAKYRGVELVDLR